MKGSVSAAAAKGQTDKTVKIPTILLVFLALLSALTANAVPKPTQFELRDNIFNAAKEGVLRMPEVSVLANPDIKGGQLDNRVRLAACPGPLIAEPAHQSFRGGRITIKVSCETDISWSIYVPVTVVSDVTVVKVNRTLPRGSILNKRDLQEILVRRAPGHLPIINHIEDAIGSALKRPINEGTELQHSMLEAPVIIKRGDQTVIEAGNERFTVRMTGRALQNGAVGEQIRVQNLASKRTVQGQVQANGKIAITQW